MQSVMYAAGVPFEIIAWIMIAGVAVLAARIGVAFARSLQEHAHWRRLARYQDKQRALQAKRPSDPYRASASNCACNCTTGNSMNAWWRSR